MIIHMLIGYSGGRHDDRPWPPLYTDFEVPDWEGEGLIRVGHAQFVRPSAPLPVPPPASPVPVPVLPPEKTLIPGPAKTAGSEPAATAAGPSAPAPQEPEPVPPVPEPEPDPEPEPAAPGPADPKTAWIDYAIRRGADAETAVRMTKADLMSRYGGRL